MVDRLVNETVSRFGLPAPGALALVRELLSIITTIGLVGPKVSSTGSVRPALTTWLDHGSAARTAEPSRRRTSSRRWGRARLTCWLVRAA
jgi:hypothetical protein